jgi:hypothetical protein
MDFSEMMFYAEAEGFLPTRMGKINAVIKDIKDDPRPWLTKNAIEKIIEKNGLHIEDLTEREIRYINASILK